MKRTIQLGLDKKATYLDLTLEFGIYLGVGNTMIIDDAALGRCIQIISQGNKTAVVWNPWEKISADMADLEDADYQRLLCVETTNAADDVVQVEPGSECRLVANYSVIRS